VDGEPRDLGSMRPKSRSLLRWLAMEAGHLIHRETIIAALWPDDDLPAATRKLHVAITSLRQLLSATESKRGTPLLVREGQSYLFTLGSDVRTDTVRFESLLSEAESARIRGDLEVATTALEAALNEYAGDLLPEEGPAPWVVDVRERYRLQAGEAVAKLVGLLRQSPGASPQRMIESCERGLQIDRYSDTLWRYLIDIHEDRGDIAKAARLRIHYAEMLAELGIRDRTLDQTPP
jgi:LuxR family transcriptional regulator, maltose regulon positive regulatory protein